MISEGIRSIEFHLRTLEAETSPVLSVQEEQLQEDSNSDLTSDSEVPIAHYEYVPSDPIGTY